MLFNGGFIKMLDDMKGKKVWVFGKMLGDFVFVGGGVFMFIFGLE